MTPPGQRDYSTVRLSRHALERFVERFGAEPEAAPDDAAARPVPHARLGRNPENGAIAVLAVHRVRALVAIVQEATCLTVLTWNQFVPRLAEFGRSKLPRKWGRTLRRLTDPAHHESGQMHDASRLNRAMARSDEEPRMHE